MGHWSLCSQVLLLPWPPSHTGAGDASHSVISKTVKFRGGAGGFELWRAKLQLFHSGTTCRTRREGTDAAKAISFRLIQRTTRWLWKSELPCTHLHCQCSWDFRRTCAALFVLVNACHMECTLHDVLDGIGLVKILWDRKVMEKAEGYEEAMPPAACCQSHHLGK